MKNKIERYAEMQKAVGSGCCPRCGLRTLSSKLELNALSRRADVYICSPCGTDEAILDAFGRRDPLEKWYIISGQKMQ